MPPAIAEWPVKNFAALYLALYKESTNTKLTAADSKAIDNNLPIYISRAIFPIPMVILELCKEWPIWRVEPWQIWPISNIKAQIFLLFGQRKTLLRLERVQKYSRNGYAK
jgi:hypothetical protein